MLGCGSESALHVNVQVDSMDGVVDGRIGEPSPQRAAIDKAQAELGLEYNVREERRRELEFLEKGGNPLDFKFGNVSSLSFHSTSLINHHTEHLVNSEEKGSFALTASPHGDSVESIGRPGAVTVCEPNTADNFDGEDQLLDGKRKSKQGSRRNTVATSELSGQMDGTQNAKESDDSAIFRPYARRNRSRPNRDGARSSSNDVLQGSEAQELSSTHGASRDAKGFLLETNDQQNQSNQSLSVPKLPTSNGDLASQIKASDIQSNLEPDSKQSDQAVGLPKGYVAGEQSDLEYEKWSDEHIQTLEPDAHKKYIQIDFNGGEHVEGKELVLAGRESPPALGRAKKEIGCTKLNGFSEQKEVDNEGKNGSVAIGTKGLDSESSCTLNQGIGVNTKSDLCINRIADDASGIIGKQTFEREVLQDIVNSDAVNEKNDGKSAYVTTATAIDHNLLNQNHPGNCCTVEEKSDMQNGTASMPTIKQNEQIHSLPSEDRKNIGVDSTPNRESMCPGELHGTLDNPVQKVHDSIAMEGKLPVAHDPEVEVCPDTCLKVVDRAHEDSILEEARIIEAKHKRIAELSVTAVAGDSHTKSHWDFVLEEISWLANDFAQERLWKMTAAAQLCQQIAFTYRLWFEEQNQIKKHKRVAHTLAKAIMQFWGSAEVLLKNKQGFEQSDGRELSKNLGEPDKESFTVFELQNSGKASASLIQEYAVRFLRCNCSGVPLPQAEAPATPERITELGIMEVSWEDHFTEESLFYAVPSRAMQTYRRLIESHLVQCEKTPSGVLEGVDTSMHDTATEFVYQDTPYNEEEGESHVYYLHGVVEGNKSAKLEQRKQKSFKRSFSVRSHEQGSEMPFGHCNIESPQNVTLGKRPAGNYGVGPVPPKRSRTASRQRIVGPFNPGVSGTSQAPTKTDASSGDTSSFQDDHSTLHGGPQIQKGVEVESVADFENQLVYDGTDTSTKPKKKKKAKHLDCAYEHSWQLDSTGPKEQRDNTKKRLDGHHFDSNGTSGLYGQHTAKKPKLIKQPLDNNFDVVSSLAGSIPSPVTSQMSNMPNTNKVMRIFNGREKGRKAKLLKISSGQVGSGIPWSTSEDQALVVLVHDMGPNWELVGDAINCALQFKCIFRKPKECKERHRVLMDKGASDGADSAEDSGSSQSYPSTLRGIPKGSARQLFQHLQGPIEEDALKSHFEKIIMIGKRQHFRKSQIDHVDAKQLVPPHNSHVIALSQVCPNNLNGVILTPLDLCDTNTSNPDVPSLGIQGSHGNGLVIPNQGSVAPILPTFVANSSLQGSSGVVLGNNCPSPSGIVNAAGRDGRYNAPRTPLPVEEQQRIQQKIQHHSQMLCVRNLQQPNLSVSGPLAGADHGIRMLPGGNGMGVMSGINRSMPVPRPGLHGMASSPILNSGSVISSGMVGVQSAVNLHSGSGSGQGNSMLRSRDGLHTARPAHNTDHQRQMMVPEHQMQTIQGNSQGVPTFNGLSSAFANQTIPPSGQTYPIHQHQHHHQMSPQQSHVLGNPHHSHLQGPSHVPVLHQQAYAVRLAKERQMRQQRLLQHQQQQQQFAASGALIPHVQLQSQLPVSTVSSSMQISIQIQPQSSPQSVSLSPSTPPSPMTSVSLQQQQQQQQQKNALAHHGLSQNTQSGASGLANQVGKQRQRQPQQQQLQPSGRHHPQQRQHSESPQKSKALKGMGKNVMVHQNLIDHHHMNGLSLPPGNQGSEKGEQVMQVIQSQAMYSTTGMGAVQMSKPLVSSSSNHSQAPHKVHSTSPPNSSKQAQKMPSHFDNKTQSALLTVTSNHAPSSTHQAVPSSMMASNHQRLQPQPNKINISQAQPSMQRLIQPNCQMDPDTQNKFHTDQDHDDQLMDNVSQIRNSIAVIAQAFSDSSNALSVVAPATTPQWKPSETILDSVIPNSASQVGSIGSPTLSYPAGSDTVVSVNRSLGQRQTSGAFPQHGHVIVSNPSRLLVHPQEQQLQEEKQHSPRKQLALQEQSQQLSQHMQSVQGSLYTRPNSSRPE